MFLDKENSYPTFSQYWPSMDVGCNSWENPTSPFLRPGFQKHALSSSNRLGDSKPVLVESEVRYLIEPVLSISAMFSGLRNTKQVEGTMKTSMIEICISLTAVFAITLSRPAEPPLKVIRGLARGLLRAPQASILLTARSDLRPSIVPPRVRLIPP